MDVLWLHAQIEIIQIQNLPMFGSSISLKKGPYWSNCKWYALSALERLQEWLYLGYVWSQFRMESEMGMVQYMGPDPRYQWVASF